MKLVNRIVAAYKVIVGKSTVVPANFEREDAIAGKFKISSSPEYTRINIEGREFFFTSTGKFDGTGFSFCNH